MHVGANHIAVAHTAGNRCLHDGPGGVCQVGVLPVTEHERLDSHMQAPPHACTSRGSAQQASMTVYLQPDKQPASDGGFSEV